MLHFVYNVELRGVRDLEALETLLARRVAALGDQRAPR